MQPTSPVSIGAAADNTPIRVVYVTDDQYQLLTQFSACSVMLSSKTPLSLVIYNTGSQIPPATGLLTLASKLGHTLETAALDTSRAINSNVPLHAHISPATLLKAQAIEREADSFEQILFLDGDVLACHSFDLSEVFGFQTTAAAVYDFVSYMPFDGQDLLRHRERTGHSPEYFNAGVIAVSGSRWLAGGMTTRYLDNLSAHNVHCPFRHDRTGKDPGDCKGADQCALNMTLEGDWTPLDFRWNVQKTLRHHPLWRTAYLRHYTGFRKFLSRSNVNRDSLERAMRKGVKRNAGLKPELRIWNDLGLLFIADSIKYRSQSRAYSRKVDELTARAKISVGSA